MTKQEFCAIGLTNGLKMAEVDDEGKIIGVKEIYSGRYNSFIEFPYYKPIVRSLDDLTKPIVQVDYNNGEPFVPIMELAKLALDNPKSKWKIVDGMAVDDNTNCFLFDKKTFDFNLVSTKLGMVGSIANQLKLFQLLLKWHFDLITKEYEKVFVTDEFNPY